MEGQFLVRQIYDDEITYNLIGAAVEVLSEFHVRNPLQRKSLETLDSARRDELFLTSHLLHPSSLVLCIPFPSGSHDKRIKFYNALQLLIYGTFSRCS